ncbi:hypothetical protein GCM10011391_11180 [Pullulanibacillus camelliae]|uniref:Peptidoglycan-binding protein n=1 Tax=Pullulanibacillus camelliae TaxID=1707096 RepID=A0A8J2VNC8_9BACL|nr:peptidoglycan-binding protein [Pullulanibacillus camelliae]GGE34235.1 hypothetical protein GCM10011391_11180 [Pullulanibacillus camelliae]
MTLNRGVAKKLAVATTITGTLLSLPTFANAQFGHETLHKGSQDEHVKNLQKVLSQEGYYKLSRPTGHFGTATEKAVKQFQEDNHLKVDGLVGPETKEKLKHYLKFDGKLISLGEKGGRVKGVQEDLKDLGYYSGNVDGIFGNKTQGAVENFQANNDLKQDGIIGEHTFKALYNSPKPASSQAPKTEEAAVQNVDVKKQQVQTTSRTLNANHSKVLYMNSTAYTAFCSGCSGTTATGINLRTNPDAKVVAVDPDVIPLGTKLYIDGYGYAVAGDTGGAIHGKHIDLFMSDHNDALHWGRRTVKVKILD